MKILFLYLFSVAAQSAIFFGTNSLNNIENESFPFIVSSNQANTKSHQLYVDVNNSDLYLKSIPAEIYIPVMASGAGTLVENDTLFSGYLPDPYNGVDDAIGVQVYHDEINDRKVYLAYEASIGDDDWTIASTSTSPNIPNSSGTVVTLSPNDKRIVYFDISGIFREKGIDPTGTTVKTNFEEKVKAVMFTSLTNYLVGETMKPADLPEKTGLFFEVKVTDRIPGPGVAIAQVNPLDGQAELEIAANSPTNLGGGLYKLAIHIDTTGDMFSAGDFRGITADNPLSTGFSPRIEDGVLSGTLTLDNLTNNVDYEITASYISRFQVVGPYLDSLQVRPDEILTFLREKSCFIVSAGFGEDHFVIDYFREFRDEILSEFSLGQKFINWYYKNSPALAVKIYHQPVLKLVVKSLSFALYFIMKYGVVIFALLSAIYYLRKRYLKIV